MEETFTEQYGEPPLERGNPQRYKSNAVICTSVRHGNQVTEETLLQLAEFKLKELLNKQLSTSLERPEQVDFTHSQTRLQEVGFGSSGVLSLAQFREYGALREAEENSISKDGIRSLKSQAAGSTQGNKQKHEDEKPLHIDSVVRKRKMESSHNEHEYKSSKEYEVDHRMNTSRESERLEPIAPPPPPGRHALQLEASLLQGMGKPLQGIAHLSFAGSGGRRPLEVDNKLTLNGVTPLDSVRNIAESPAERKITDVFSAFAPPILDMGTFLKEFMVDEGEEQKHHQKPLVEKDIPAETDDLKGSVDETPLMFNISDDEIQANRLSLEELRSRPKFGNYQKGHPSKILYLKNIGPDVTKNDVVVIFQRFQEEGKPPLIYRLMQHGRMKGQAFITFPSIVMAEKALLLVNGYKLKGSPLVIQYGRQSLENEPAC